MSAKKTAPDVAIVVPTYNEEKQIGVVIDRLLEVRGDNNWEIVVVDDGSSDGTPGILAERKDKVRVVTHRSNHGYGAALKTGIHATRARDVIFFDADGQHSAELIPEMVKRLQTYEFVIGVRQTQEGIPFIRRPGKLVLKVVVSFLVGRMIEDVNCGFRGGRRRLYLRMLELLPDGFSFSTTSLVYALQSRYYIDFLPIPSQARKGFSTVRILSDGLKALLLCLRLIMLFDPLRAFVAPAFFLFLVGCIYQLYILAATGLHIVGGAILLILAGVILFHFGLLADQVASLRKEMSAQLGLLEESRMISDSDPADERLPGAHLES